MFKKLFFLAMLLLIGGIVALPFLAIDQRPEVTNNVSLTAREIDSAKALLKRIDPRRLEAGELVTQWIDEEEAELIGGYLLRQLGGGGLDLRFSSGRAHAQVSLPLPDNPIGSYLNLSVTLSQWSRVLELDELRAGRVVIPGWLGEYFRDFGHRALMQVPEYAAAIDALNGLQLMPGRVLVAYQWRPELVDQLKSRGQQLAVDDAMRQRLIVYSNQINAIAQNPALGREVSITEFMTPLFFLAQARADDPIEENRAALLALSFYFSGVDISRYLGVELPPQPAANRRMTISGRYDFAQHFLTSAALTATGNVGIADAIGLFKELDDARGGSGFSFTDLGADRAGVKAAEFATANETQARHFQDVMTGVLREDDFMPDFLDLPELLNDNEFRSRYGGVGGPGYQKIVADIERRLDQCPLYN